jgi:hypothetical protein
MKLLKLLFVIHSNNIKKKKKVKLIKLVDE